MTDFENIYKMYFNDVFLFVKGLSRNDHIAEEITEETFFKAIKNINKFDGNCDIRVWLCQIAKNTYYTYCKKQKRFADNDALESLSENFIFSEKLEDKEKTLRIHHYLHQMKEPYKEVFSLRVFGELSFIQIGKIFGKSESWARVTYHRAKSKIISYIEENRFEK